MADLLNSTQVMAHPFVIGELACGNLHNRNDILKLLNDLPQTALASQKEVLHFLECNKLMGLELGFIDVHLLASTALTDTTFIWTRDKRLQKVARKLKLAV